MTSVTTTPGGPAAFLLDLALENIAVLYWDARSGLTRDWTDHGMSGQDVVAGTVPRALQANHWEFRTIPAGPPGNNQIRRDPPDNVPLRVDEGTIMVLGPFSREAAVNSGDTLVAMDDGAMASYRLALNVIGANSITFADNVGGLASWSWDYRGAKTIAVSFGPGVASRAYIDGNSLASSAVISPTYPLPMKTFCFGNSLSTPAPSQNPLTAVVVCNERLTGSEVRRLHEAVTKMQWATLPYQQWKEEGDNRLDWGFSASASNSYGPGADIPFSLTGAGICRIVEDKIQGDVVKCYENRDPNILELPYSADGLSPDNDPVRFASGVWEWWWKYDDNMFPISNLLCKDFGIPDWWELVDDGGNLSLVSQSLGTIGMWPSTLGAGWTGFRVERDPGPSWEWRVYINGSLDGTFNPGAVVTQAEFGGMYIPPSGKLAIGSRDGRFNWRRKV